MMITQVPPRRQPGGGTPHSLDAHATVVAPTLRATTTRRRGTEHLDSHRPSCMLQEFRRRHIIAAEEQYTDGALLGEVVVPPTTNGNNNDDNDNDDRRQREAAQRRRERWQRGIMMVGSSNSSKDKDCRRLVTPTNEDSNWGDDEKRGRRSRSNSTNKGQIVTTIGASRQTSSIGGGAVGTKSIMWHSSTATSASNYSRHNSCAHVGIDNVRLSLDEIRDSLRDVIITAKQIVTSVRRFGPAEREAVRETLADAHQFVSERVQQLPMTTWMMTPVGGGGDVCGGGGDCRRQRSNTSIPCVERSVEGPRTRVVRRVSRTTTREHDDPSSNHRHTIPTKTKTTTVISNTRQEQCDPMSSVDSDEMCRTSRRNNNYNPEMHKLADHYKEVDDNNTVCARIGVTTMEV
jgi:hypothetical protein